MQRLALSLSSVLLLTASAAAQPAPVDPNAPPPPPAEPAAAPQPEPAVVVEPPPPPKKEEAPLPKKIGVGTISPGSFFTPGLNFQGWFVYNHTVKAGAAGADDIQSSTSTFRIRRLEISGTGEIVPKLVKYRFMFDLGRVTDTRNPVSVTGAAGTPVTINQAPNALSTLQDAWATVTTPYVDVLVGQLKTPVGWEGFGSAAKFLFPDRSFGTNKFSGLRDVGIRLEKQFKKFAYYAGVFNGSGQNQLDTNNQKDVGLRVEVYPVPGLTIAGVTYDSVGYRTKAGTKDRWEGDLRYESGPFLFQSEFIYAKTVNADNADPVKAYAAYAALGYTFKGIGSGIMKGDIQPVVRFGYDDPNADDNLVPANAAAADERMDFEAGLNYYLRGHETKFQLAYDRQQFDDSDVKKPVDEVILAMQVWY